MSQRRDAMLDRVGAEFEDLVDDGDEAYLSGPPAGWVESRVGGGTDVDGDAGQRTMKRSRVTGKGRLPSGSMRIGDRK
jgi:hypothetical protein